MEEEKALTLDEEKELAKQLLHYLDLLAATDRSDERKAMRMKIELMIQRARQSENRRALIEDAEQDKPKQQNREAAREQAMEKSLREQPSR